MPGCSHQFALVQSLSTEIIPRSHEASPATVIPSRLIESSTPLRPAPCRTSASDLLRVRTSFCVQLEGKGLLSPHFGCGVVGLNDEEVDVAVEFHLPARGGAEQCSIYGLYFPAPNLVSQAIDEGLLESGKRNDRRGAAR